MSEMERKFGEKNKEGGRERERQREKERMTVFVHKIYIYTHTHTDSRELITATERMCFISICSHLAVPRH